MDEAEVLSNISEIKETKEIKDHKVEVSSISPYMGKLSLNDQIKRFFPDIGESLKCRIRFEKTISTISSRFVGTLNIDDAIDASLRDLGILSGASRISLFLFRDNKTTVDNTHEWCVEGVTPQIDNLKNLPSDIFSEWIKGVYKEEVIHIKDVSRLSQDAKVEKEILQGHDIKSFLPLIIEREVAGFIGFNNVIGIGEWYDEDLAILRISSEIIGNALERKKKEDQLHQEKKKVEQLSEELDIAYKRLKTTQNELLRRGRVPTIEALAAGIAHEIRNPLVIIGMTIQYLQSKLSENDPKRELTRAIIKKVERLDRVTKELFSYGKVMNLNIRRQNLHRCLNLNLVLVKPKCKLHGIKIRKRYSRLPLIEMDDEQMDKVFFNIMDNAMKAMPNGGVLTVSTEFDEGVKIAIIKIHNTGPAIKRRHLPYIFEPFYRIDERGEGIGLGLAIAQNVVLRHGGQITVENKSSGKDKGIAFIIRLPSSKGGKKETG